MEVIATRNLTAMRLLRNFAGPKEVATPRLLAHIAAVQQVMGTLHILLVPQITLLDTPINIERKFLEVIVPKKILKYFRMTLMKNQLRARIDRSSMLTVLVCEMGKKELLLAVEFFFGNDDPRNISVPLAGEEQTNNRAELQAIILALENTSGDLTIRSDSNYSIKSLTTWLPKWKKNDFKTSNSQPVKNLDLINRASDLMSDRNVSLEYVKGHSTDYGNQQADMLARRGASE